MGSLRDEFFLVTGATGAQGGATARALLNGGHAVRVLCRQPDSPAAQALARLGAQVVGGDFADAGSLQRALAGVKGVFSVQLPSPAGQDSERRHATALIAAAREAGVEQFVHTSVARAGEHTGFPRWDSGYWTQKYWTDKWDIEEAVRHAGFARWTVLKPAFMMDNFAYPKVKYMFPHLREGRLLTALNPGTRMQLIAADDVGAFACAAFMRPARFHGQTIALASEELTMEEVARLLSRKLGRPVVAESVTPQEALKAGLNAGWVRSQEWSNEVSYGVDIGKLAQWDVPLIPFEDWLERHTTAAAPGN
jgi:uncharacterized protein YbjT (DUF2867 family)